MSSIQTKLLRLKGLLLATLLLSGLPQSELVAQDDPEFDLSGPLGMTWKRSASAGLTLTAGNTETAVASADLLFSGKNERSKLEAGVNAVYGTDSGDTTAQTFRAFSQYNRDINEDVYGYIRADALHDEIADVDFRLTLGPGLGYKLINKEEASLGIELGGAVIYEKLAGESDTYASVRLAETYERQLSENAKIWQSAEFLPQVDEFDNFLLISEIGIESKLNDSLSLRVVLQDRFDNEPAPGRKRNDVKLISGVSYSF